MLLMVFLLIGLCLIIPPALIFLMAKKGSEVEVPLGAILHAFVTLQPITGGKIDDLVEDFIDFAFKAMVGNAEVPLEELGKTLKECLTYALKNPAPALIGGSINFAGFGIIRKIAKKIGGPGVRIPGVAYIKF